MLDYLGPKNTMVGDQQINQQMWRVFVDRKIDFGPRLAGRHRVYHERPLCTVRLPWSFLQRIFVYLTK